jgi:hypothetical protein
MSGLSIANKGPIAMQPAAVPKAKQSRSINQRSITLSTATSRAAKSEVVQERKQ